MNIYDNILNCPEFCDSLFPRYAQPFRQDEYCAVTNGTFLVIIPKMLVEGEYELQDKPDLKRFVENKPVCNMVFSYKDIKETLDAIPVCDTEVCDACKGEGAVTYHFDYNGVRYTYEHCCPICDGDGRIYTDEMVKDDRYLVKVNEKYITMNNFRKLQLVASFFSNEIITLVIQDNFVSGFILDNIFVYAINSVVKDEKKIKSVILKEKRE